MAVWGLDLFFPFLFFLAVSTACLLFSPFLLLHLFFFLSAPLLIPALLSQLPPWGLSSPSPSPPPSLPTSLEPCLEPPGCYAAGGCLAGSLRRHPRHLQPRSCSECREERWIATIVPSAPSHCPTRRGRSYRTRGGTSTRTARMSGCPCS